MTFTANQRVTADELNGALGTILDAVTVTVSPIITAAAFSSETEIPRWLLTASVVSGRLYVIAGQITYNMSVNDTETDIIFREDTTLTGTLMGAVRLGKPSTSGNGHTANVWIPWKCNSTSTAKQIHVSVRRIGGTGNTVLEPTTSSTQANFLSIHQAAPDNSVFRTVTV